MKDRKKRVGACLAAGMLGLASTTTGARGDSAAGFFRAETPSNGTVLVSMPFHPFAEGRLDDVLRGTLVPGAIPGEGADASLWIAEAQSMTNAWLQAQGEDGAPRWVGGTSAEDATPFEQPLSAGDALFIRNRQPAPAHVFLSGLVLCNHQFGRYSRPLRHGAHPRRDEQRNRPRLRGVQPDGEFLLHGRD